MDARTRIEILVAACHSAWYAYAVLALGEPGEPWDAAPEWQRESIRDGVRFWDLWARTYERQVAQATCSEEVRDNFAKASHTNWVDHKMREGWTYGEVKDVETKQHPCLVKYEALPEAQKKKDRAVIQAYFAVRSALPGQR